MWLFPSFAQRAWLIWVSSSVSSHWTVTTFKKTNFSPSDWEIPPVSQGVCRGDKCRLLVNLGVHTSMNGRWAWSRVFQCSLNAHMDFAVPIFCGRRHPLISGDMNEILGWQNITCWRFSFSFSFHAQTQRLRHTHRPKKIPTHISAFSSHLTANAVWVMLELAQKISGWAFIHIWMMRPHFECC